MYEQLKSLALPMANQILYDTQPVAQILALFMGYLIVKKTLKIICDFYHVCV